MYRVIKKEELKKYKNYLWFSTFSNPCYGFNVKMDVSNVVEFCKKTKTSFFINVLYLVTKGCSSVDELRMRIVDDEIRIYDSINPTFTVMTKEGIYENAGFEMVEDYKEFYKTARDVIDTVKNQDGVKNTFNDNEDLSDYYMTCIPWLSYEGMTHPIPDNNPGSCSVPRICWDKYRMENGKYFMTLNITVSHALVDGYPLSVAFNTIQKYFNDIDKMCN